MIERNPMWAPIALTPRMPTLMCATVVDAYRAAAPVRVCTSQRYSLVVTEPLPAMVQR